MEDAGGKGNIGFGSVVVEAGGGIEGGGRGAPGIGGLGAEGGGDGSGRVDGARGGAKGACGNGGDAVGSGGDGADNGARGAKGAAPMPMGGLGAGSSGTGSIGAVVVLPGAMLEKLDGANVAVGGGGGSGASVVDASEAPGSITTCGNGITGSREPSNGKDSDGSSAPSPVAELRCHPSRNA